VAVASCEVCMQVTDVVFDAAGTTIHGSSSVAINCLVLKKTQNLGPFSAVGNFKNLETKCFPVSSDEAV
jgi:hypothetical protein